MKRIILGAVVGLFVASCSNNETVSLNQDEIQFNVVANKVAKAADLYCNNKKPEAFNVWASYKKDANTTAATYFAGDEIKNVSGAWVNQTDDRYWPEAGTLNFYAHVNGTFNWTVDQPTIDFTVAAKAKDQKDLLYAVTTEKSRNQQVNMNFRHALSQIVFKAANNHEKLHVVIEAVKVCNLKYDGTFAFSESTEVGFPDHSQAGTAPTTGLGEWTLEDYKTSYEVTLPNPVTLTKDVKALTGNYTDGNDGFTMEEDGNTLLLMPQTSNAWDPATKYGVETAKTYFLVKCRIYNIADLEKGYQNGDVMLWGKSDSEGKYVAIPFTASWEQGKKYIYTFIFNNYSNGGYDEESKPVLYPITFDVTVDDFTNATDKDVEMVKK